MKLVTVIPDEVPSPSYSEGKVFLAHFLGFCNQLVTNLDKDKSSREELSSESGKPSSNSIYLGALSVGLEKMKARQGRSTEMATGFHDPIAKSV